MYFVSFLFVYLYAIEIEFSTTTTTTKINRKIYVFFFLPNLRIQNFSFWHFLLYGCFESKRERKRDWIIIKIHFRRFFFYFLFFSPKVSRRRRQNQQPIFDPKMIMSIDDIHKLCLMWSMNENQFIVCLSICLVIRFSK